MPAAGECPWIESAIESVLRQKHPDFELIILDDVVNRKTFGRICRYKNDFRVRIYRNASRLGPGGSRNRIIGLSRGEYIVPCDADDIMLPGCLEHLSRYLDRHPGTDTVYADLISVDHDRNHRVCVAGRDCAEIWDLQENAVNHPGSMTRKASILRAGGYDEDVLVDDWSLWLKLSERGVIRYLPGKIYYLYRRHRKGISYNPESLGDDIWRIRRRAVRRRYGMDILDIKRAPKKTGKIFPDDIFEKEKPCIEKKLGPLVFVMGDAGRQFYRFGGTEAFIWRRLDKPRAVKDLARMVEKNYFVSRKKALGDLRDFAGALSREGLIKKSRKKPPSG